jgi:ketosteroid isomerase-like protein
MTPTRRSLLVAAAAVSTVAAGASAARADVASDPDVADLVRRAALGHAALMAGDLEAYRKQLTLADDFTLMAPFGGKPSRAADLTAERWAAIARFFRNGRHATLDLVQAYRSGDMVVLGVIERAHVEVGGLPGQDWALRVTLVFRRDQGRWLLAHRHADPLVEGISLEQAAVLARRAG